MFEIFFLVSIAKKKNIEEVWKIPMSLSDFSQSMFLKKSVSDQFKSSKYQAVDWLSEV